MAGNRAYWLLFALAAALILGLWMGMLNKSLQDKQEVLADVERHTSNLARAFEEHTVRTLKSVDQAALFLKFQYQQYGTRVDIQKDVREGVILDALFNQLGVIDEHGMYVLSNLPNHKVIDLSDREHFNVHVKADTNQLFVSKPVLGRASGKWSIQLTRRINKPDGSFGGVVTVSLDPQYFTRFYNEVDVGRGGVISMVGADGVIRVRMADGKYSLGQDISASPLFDALRQGRGSGSYRLKSIADGVVRLYSFRKLAEYPLSVIVGVSEDTALADFNERRRGDLRYTIGMTAVVLFFAVMSAGMLLRQRRISDALQVSQAKAEEANRLKSEFLASMSHELRTPLNGIIGYAEYLRDAGQDETQVEFAGVIYDSSQHLLALVNSLLDLAKIEAGKLVLNIAEEPLTPLLEQLASLHRAAAENKGLRFECQLAATLPSTLSCDRVRLVQVLNNLLHNAIKFTAAGSVQLSVTSSGRCVRFAVIDSGPGIALASQTLIFEKFRQADAFITRQHGGSGLGLALSKELVSLMGGDLRLRSEPGQGSEFYFDLATDAQ